MSSTPSGFSAFFAELRRRRVFRVAAVYAVVAWLITQIAATTFPHLNLPGWMITAVIVLVALGFPIALVLAWAFDLTPDGVIRAEPRRQASEADASPRRWTGQRIAALGGVVILALAGGAFVLLGGSFQRVAPVNELDRSIAVLPFGNLSAEPENEYFSDGITDEIITTLAGVRDLRVISRTSAMRYKNTQKSLREIADELGVTHVLVGSGQRDGERVRVRAQLIDAGTDTNLWAERYDRPLQDIFAVQSEIAQQIARALQAELSDAERRRLTRQPTTDPTAHDYLLRGKEFLRRPSLRDNEAGIALLRRAREQDPTYPDVHAALAQAFAVRIWLFGDRVWLDSAVIAARRAITLDPHYAAAYAQLGWALDWAGDRDGALEAHQRAVALNPNLSDGLASLYHWSFGRLDEAARSWGPAVRADPTNNVIHWLAGRTYLQLGMPARARLYLEKAIEFEPAFPSPHAVLMTALLLEDRREEARARIPRMLAATSDAPDAFVLAGQVAVALDDLPTARRFLERGLPDATDWLKASGALLLAWVLQQSDETAQARTLVHEAARRFDTRWGGSPKRSDDFVDLARIRILEGDPDAALRLLEEGVLQGWRFIYELPPDPILNSLRGDPRYDRLMAEVKADIDRMRERVEREGW